MLGEESATEPLTKILDTIAEGVVYQEASGEIRLWNRSAEKIFRLPADQALGQTSLSRNWNMICQDGKPCPGDQHPSMITLATGRPLEGQVRGLKWADGSVTWISINTQPVFKPGREKPIAVVISFTDFTQRMLAENALIDSNERYQTFIENAEEAIFRSEFREPVDVSLGVEEQIVAVNANSYVAECNSALANLYGLEAVEDLIGCGTARLFDGNTPASREVIRKFIESGYRTVSSENEITSATGRKKHVIVNSVGLVENGRLVRTWGSVRDITRRKQAEDAARQSESRLKMALEAASAEIWEWNPDNSDEMRAREFPGRRRVDKTEPDDRTRRRSVLEADWPKVEAALREAATNQSTLKIEWRSRATDGSIRWFMTLGRPQYENDKLSKYVGVAVDVTEVKLAQEALNESKLFLDNISDLAYLIDNRGNILWANPAAEKFTGRPLAEIIGQPVAALLIESDRSILQQVYERVLDGESLEGVFSFKSGVACNFTALPKRNDQGHIVGVFGVARDISESLANERALRESEDKFATAVKHAPMLMTMSDLETGALIEVNEAWCASSGHTRSEALGRTAVDLGWLTMEQREDLRAKLLEQGFLRNMELKVHNKSGEPVYALVNTALVSLAGRRIMLTSALDITDSKNTEQRLRESEEIFRRTFRTSPDSININRLGDGLYIDINDGFTRMTGFTREDVAGKTSADIQIWNDPADRLKLVQSIIDKGYCENLEAQFRRKDGSLLTALMSASLIHLNGEAHTINVTRDISELKQAQAEKERLEAQLNQAQKMEALGTLAGGIAHDFNNILASIIGHSELALDELPADSTAAGKIRRVVKAGGRAKDLVTQILTFSRKLEPELKSIDLNQIVDQTKIMLGRAIPKMVDIERRLAENLWPVNADSGQMIQLVMNLWTNASDAMPDGGRLVIETANVTLDQPNGDEWTDKGTGKFVRLTISDTGCGMDRETQKHIFDPFFTLKEVGKGTGLGLATVYGIVKNHCGQIECRSEPGRGTTFRIYLPAADTDPTEPIRAKDPGQVLDGNETILLVDDEMDLRQLGQAILNRQGYRVLLAQTGEEALEIYDRQRSGIDLIILDISMPGMGGKACLERLLQIDPGIKVIIASGYSLNGAVADVTASGAAAYIAKPFSRSDLLQLIRKTLDQ